jgi:zinc transport system permease protein
VIEILQYEFMRNALFAGLLAAITCGIIGSYVVVKRMVFISGGISHASLGGVGMGYFLGINPILGALFFTPAVALAMGLVTKRTKLPEDTAIGILWAVGMALGFIFIGLTPGYLPDPFSYLIGDILMVSSFDIVLMIILAIVIVSVIVLLYKEFLSLSFDEEFSTVVGVPTEPLYLILLCLIALTVVVLIRVVGIILVIALLTIPAAMARQFTYSLKRMMLISVLLCAVFAVAGLWLSYELDLPSGPTIILVGGTAFLVSLVVSKLGRKKLPPQNI